MDERVARPPWELAATPLGFLRTWVRVTFHPRAFIGSLTEPASLLEPVLYALVALVLRIALVGAVLGATTYSSLRRFGATETLGRILAHQMGWYVGDMFCGLVAAGLSTWLVTSLARRPLADALRARMYTLGPLTYLIGWWVMFRWLQARSDSRHWRPRLLALAGLIAEVALAVALSSLLTDGIGDAVGDALIALFHD